MGVMVAAEPIETASSPPVISGNESNPINEERDSRGYKRVSCGAIKKDGTKCNAIAMGNGKCYYHGGKTPNQLASASAGTSPNNSGKYTHYLDRSLQGRYQQSLSDPELLALRDEVALIELRIAEVSARLKSAGSSEVWSNLVQTVNRLESALSAGNADKIGELIRETISLVRSGNAIESNWADLFAAISRKGTISELQHAREQKLHQTMSVADVLALVQAVAQSVQLHCTDRNQRRAIQLELQRITRQEVI